jgi:hypothetical protein
MTATARQNISFVRDYLAAVLNAVAVLEAIAKCAGTSAPMARSLLGLIGAEASRFPAPPAAAKVEAGMHQLLKSGLADPGQPGLQALPLAAHLYQFLGQEGSRQTLQQATHMFDGTLTPRAFLQNLDRGMVCAIIQAAAALDAPHQEAFLALEHSLDVVHVAH